VIIKVDAIPIGKVSVALTLILIRSNTEKTQLDESIVPGFFPLVRLSSITMSSSAS